MASEINLVIPYIVIAELGGLTRKNRFQGKQRCCKWVFKQDFERNEEGKLP